MAREYFRFQDPHFQVADANNMAERLIALGWQDVLIKEDLIRLVGGIIDGEQMIVSGIRPEPVSAAMAAMMGE